MKKQTKKPNSFWLKNKQILYIALATMCLLLGLSYGAVAQNTAYGTDALKSITTGNGNAAFGYQALFSNTYGYNNTANGYQALYYSTVSYNTANGYQALYANTTGGYNTANGYHALLSNITGSNNTANGVNALRNNTAGYSNAANGYEALALNTTGSYNTANGYQALFSNTTGYSNAANGYQALRSNTTGNLNTANGQNALYRNDGGGANTANGFGALQSNTTGSNNTALGYNTDVASGNLTNTTVIGANAKVTASNAIQLGNDSVTKVFAGVGKSATLIAGGLQITGGTPAAGKVLTSDASGVATWQTPMSGGTGWGLTGNLGTVDGTNFIGTTDNAPFNIRVNNQKAGRIDANNAFYGYQSGNARTTGGFNTANGYQALYANTTGDGNTAIGDRSMSANTEGNYNTAIGSLALNTSTKGKYNTAIGYNADIADKDKMGNDITNATAIGNAAWVDESNKVVIGDRNVTVIGGYANWSNLSDARFKKNIQQDVHGLDFITKLNPITYNLDIKKLNSFLGVDERNAKRQQQPSPQQTQAIATKEAIRYTGFLAQEVEQAAQTVNYNFSGVIKPASDKGHYSMSYSDFVVPLVKAVQEQEKKIEQQDQKIEDQQKQIDELKKLVTQITGGNNVTKDVATKEVGTANAEDINLLYPNPTTGICTITTSNIDNGVIEIYDMAGNSMQKTTFNNAKSGYQLNVSGYAKGVYLLNITANNKKYTKRLVIQ